MIENLLGQLLCFLLSRHLFKDRILQQLLLNQVAQLKRCHLQHLNALTQLGRQHQTLGKTGRELNGHILTLTSFPFMGRDTYSRETARGDYNRSGGIASARFTCGIFHQGKAVELPRLLSNRAALQP